MTFATCDLCDDFEDQAEYQLRVVAPMFKSYGAISRFKGPVATLKIFEDNTLVREVLSTEGQGRVLVIDGGGSMRCALVGDQLGALAVKNGWAGMVVWGCIRDSVILNTQAIGVRALDTNPKKSLKKGVGDSHIPVTFGGVTFVPGQWLYADEDGIVVTDKALPV